MKVEIKSLFEARVLFSVEVADDDPFKLRFALQVAVGQKANLRGAYLRGAYLRGAYLRGADLSDADLSDADLSGANLSGANLSGANLRDADLSDADLSDAYLRDAISNATPEEVARLDAVREIVLAKPERLRMGGWHTGGWTPDHTPEEEHGCGSAHCIAGWLQALSQDKAVREMDPSEAGRKLAPASAHMFYVHDAVALQWLKDRAYAPKEPA